MIQLDGNITLSVGQTYQLTVNNLELTLPYSEIKQTISISLGNGVTSYKLKFLDLGNGYKVQGLVNGISIKAGKDITLTNPVDLKSYRRGTVTYWSVEVLSNPVIIEDNIGLAPNIALMAIDPANINTTDDIPEGVVNLYYTDARARGVISATAPILYNNATGVVSTTLTQYTNANVGTLFTNGVHQGVSFNVGANSISATVSLNTYGIDDLADVQLGQLGLQTGQVLKYSVNKWINTKLLSTELSDTALLMRRADNLSGLANVPTARNNLGLGSAALLDANVVITTESSIGDLGNVMLANLANGQTLKYVSVTNKWVNTKLSASDIDGILGIYAPIDSPNFTGVPRAPTPANNSNSIQVATTAWVRARIAEGGGGGGGGGATFLDQLTDVSIDDLNQVNGQTLRFNGIEYVNSKLASTDLSDTANIVLQNTAPNFTTQVAGNNTTLVATTAFVQNAISSSYTANDVLSKLLTVDGSGSGLDADLLDGSHKTDFLLKADNLSGLGNVATARTNLGLGTASTQNSTSFLQVSNNLNDLNNPATSRNNLGLGTSAILDTGTGVNQILKFTVNNTLPALSGENLTALGSINTLSDVDTSGGIDQGQILVWDGTKFIPSDTPATYTDENARNAVGTALENGTHTNGVSFINNDLNNSIDLTIQLSSEQLSDSANIDLLDADQTITGNKTFTGDLDFTGSTSVLVNTDLGANGDEVANASFVRALINLAGGVTQLDDLTDVTINALSKTEGQTLRVDGTGQFVNTELAIADLSDVDLTLNGDGKTLIWDGNVNKFVSSDFPATYTDEQARNAVGTALANGVHSGISFTNDNLNNVINALVSITSANIDLNELITALGLGTSAFANTGTGEGDVAVFGADGLIVGVGAFDNGFIADDPVEASLDNGFIV